MNEDELLARFGLSPTASDLPQIRQLIQAEIANADRESNEPLKALCIQLFAAGLPGDALLIYRAKMSSFDAGSYIDIQLACGAGLETTQDFLRQSSAPEAARLLTALQNSMSAGDFDGFTPAAHLEFYRRYYKLSS